MHRLVCTAAVAMALALAVRLSGGMDERTILPMDHPAIDYTKGPVHDRVEELRKRMDEGKVKFAHDPDRGYLAALLNALHVPAASQVLVFSKTSFQAPRIYPRMPRALYHSDDISVGYVQGGDVLEIAAVDPRQGVVFYTLDQGQAVRPQIERRGECFQCHVGASTLGVPGLVVRSVHVERTGYALLAAPAYVTDHRSPLNQRWGGWYITGTHGKQFHMGNQTLESRDDPTLDLSKGANLASLSRTIYTGAYAAPTSDIVSIMVLEHQTRMTNLITRLGWEARIALHEADGQEPSAPARQKLADTAAQLVAYMLFADEAKLEAAIRGSEAFASGFTSQGPRDKRGRSLRDLDMTARMFRYPCSYLIYSRQFDALPQVARDLVLRQLFEVLSGRDQDPVYSRLSPADRQAILEILRDTKPGLPAYWR